MYILVLALHVAALSWVVLSAQDDHQQQVQSRQCKEASKDADNPLVILAVPCVVLPKLVARCKHRATEFTHSGEVKARVDMCCSTHLPSPEW